MNDLVKATGLPRSTIHHYAALGLLPERTKTSRNMAYYDPGCVDRIRLIQMLQTHHRLSLSEIAAVFANASRNEELQARLSLNKFVFDDYREARGATVHGVAAFARECGLETGQAEALLEVGLVSPATTDEFDAADIEAGRRYADALGFGVSVSDLQFYVDLLGRVVNEELALRARVVQTLDDRANAELTLRMGQNGRVVRNYLHNRILQSRVSEMRELSPAKEGDQ